eukprot:3268401-Prymnesium_polylepis.1
MERNGRSGVGTCGWLHTRFFYMYLADPRRGRIPATHFRERFALRSASSLPRTIYISEIFRILGAASAASHRACHR